MILRRSAEMGEAAAGLLSRTFFGGAGCSWSLIGKMRPDATIHWGMCTLNVQRVVGPEEDGVIQMVGSRRKKRRKTKSSDGWAGRGVICTRAGARWAADVCERPCLTSPTRSCARRRAGEMRYAPEEAWTGYGQKGWT